MAKWTRRGVQKAVVYAVVDAFVWAERGLVRVSRKLGDVRAWVARSFLPRPVPRVTPEQLRAINAEGPPNVLPVSAADFVERELSDAENKAMYEAGKDYIARRVAERRQSRAKAKDTSPAGEE